MVSCSISNIVYSIGFIAQHAPQPAHVLTTAPFLTNGLHQATHGNKFLTGGLPNGTNEKKLNTGIIVVDEEARDTTPNKTMNG